VVACNFSALAGKRIGVPRNNIYEVDNYTYPIIDAFNAALKALEAAGATIIDPTNYTALNAFFNSSAENHVLDADFVADLSAYLAQLTYNPTGVKILLMPGLSHMPSSRRTGQIATRQFGIRLST
jgi:amidase